MSVSFVDGFLSQILFGLEKKVLSKLLVRRYWADLNLYSVLLAVVTFFSTLLGGFFATKYRNNIGVLAAFAAGVLIAVPLFDILPETFKLAAAENVFLDDVMYLTALGFIFLYVIDRVFTPHRPHSDVEHRTIQHPVGGMFATTELSAHSFMDGLAIGLGFQFDLHVGIIVAVAVICHDFSDGLSAVTVMLNSGNSLKTSLRLLFLDAVTPILGAIVTLFIQVPKYYVVLFLPFFAGGFLYLGASDLLPHAHEKNPQSITIASCIAGFLLVFILARILNI